MNQKQYQDFVLRDNIFIDTNKNQTIFISKLNKINELEEIFIQDRSDPTTIIEIFSSKGILKYEDNLVLSMNNEQGFN